jgi:hypothetical protein
MAPPSADWQSLLRIQPSNIDVDNDGEVDQNEELGVLYMKVNVCDDYLI